MEQILGTMLRHNPMIRLDISQNYPKEGDRGKPFVLDVPMQEAVVNQRLHCCSEVVRNVFVSTTFGCVAVLLSQANATNPAEGVREPAHQEFNLGSAVVDLSSTSFVQLRWRVES